MPGSPGEMLIGPGKSINQQQRLENRETRANEWLKINLFHSILDDDLVEENAVNQWIEKNGWKQFGEAPGPVLISSQDEQIKTKEITEDGGWDEESGGSPLQESQI